ncbi:2OG-Fe(II) oxygenase superfamily protein [Aureococcus anophagefferens]|uniref:2OG-Fe(II) oxygenase superfamily protein n=1 Tax=Aureococcus anophagefferens TaxID=44056 RepID=A0ABR1FZ50_AURAN
MSIFRVVGAAAARVSDVIVGSASGTNSPVDDKTPRGRSRRRRSRSKKPAPLTVKRCNFIEPPTDVATLKSPVIPASATPFSEAGDDASRAERYDEVGDDASRAERYDDASHSASDAESYDVESRSASEGSYDVHVSDADMDAVVGAYEEARAALETMTERAAAAERVAADLEASLTGSRLELIAARTKLATVERSLPKKKKRAVIGTKPKRVAGLSPEDAPMACAGGGDGSWSASAGRRLSLNAKCRFLRYADGDSVQPHVDPAWDACDPSEGVDGLAPGARSWFTVIVYLNDGFRGGETTFFAPAGNGAYDLVSVAPRRGAALLFPHGAHRDSPLHEGSEVRGGSKHVLRTDVLYSDA